MKYSALHHHKISGNHELGIRYCVYLPIGYNESDRYYNTLYLLHGAGDDEYAWNCKGLAQQMLDELAWDSSIVVMPLCFLNNREMDGKYPPSRDAFETFWFNELVPSVIQNYRIHPQDNHQAMVGLSMGAEQMLDLAWRGKANYSALGCLSPVFCQETLTADSWATRWPSLSRSEYKAKRQLFYLACGKKDHMSLETSQRLSSVLTTPLAEMKSPFISDLTLPSFHEWNVWRIALKNFLTHLRDHWNISA